jgi:hypothetical protein
MNPSILALQKKAYQQLLDAMIIALEKGEMTVDDSKTSSKKIVRNLDRIENHTELLLFLQSLADKYPAYKSVYINIMQEELAHKDEQKLTELKSKLQKLTGIVTH